MAVMLLSFHMMCGSRIFNYFEQIALERFKRDSVAVWTT
jgi:hypothetical protein